MKKRFLMTGVAIVLALSMAGCGKSSSETTTENAASEEVASETDVAEDTEEVTTEEEDTSWFSENNISFTEGEVSIPAYTCALKDDDTPDDRIEVTQKEATYSEPVISVSEVDSDGNITYTVTCKISGTWSGMVPASVESLHYGIQVDSWKFVDAYTGTVFPGAAMKGDGSYDTESTVEVDGKEYKILTSESAEWNYDEGQWSVFDDASRYTASYTYSNTMTAVVPAEYDGLILCLNGNGRTEYEEIDTEVKEAHPFDGNVSEHIFKDVTYGKKLDWNEGNACLILQNDESEMTINLSVSSLDLVKTEFTEDEVKAFDKNGYVKIKWMDGTETPVTGEITYGYSPDSADVIGLVSINYDGKIDYKQVQSVIVGDEELSNRGFTSFNN